MSKDFPELRELLSDTENIQKWCSMNPMWRRCSSDFDRGGIEGKIGSLCSIWVVLWPEGDFLMEPDLLSGSVGAVVGMLDSLCLVGLSVLVWRKFAPAPRGSLSDDREALWR